MWNIQGIFETINDTKYSKLDQPEFENRLNKFDILCLQETHCGPKDIDPLAVPGYQLNHFNRSKSSNNRYFGGLLLLYKTCLKKGIKIIDNKHQDKLWIKLDKTFFQITK